MVSRFLLIGLLTISSSWAELVVRAGQYYAIAPLLEQYHGENPVETIEQIFVAKGTWLPLDNNSGQLGLVSEPVWVRLNLLSQTNEPNLLLVLNNRGLNKIEGWLLQGEKLQEFTLGALLNFSAGRTFPLTRLNQQVLVRPGEPATLYLRIIHSGYADVSAELGSPSALLQQDSSIRGLELFFYGVYLTLLFYHGILYLTSKETGYLGYCGFIATSILFFSFTEGYIWVVLQNQPNLAYTLGQGSVALMGSSAAFFTLQYLRMRKRYLAVLIMNSIFFLGIALFVIRLVIPNFPVLVIGSVVTGITFIVIPIISLHQYYRYKNPFALSYFFSWSIWSVFAIITVLTVLGINKADISSFWSSLKIAFAIQSFILAWSLGHRIKIINEERVSAIAQSNAKSDLIAKVSHEIRTPMNGIIGTSQLLDVYLKDDEAKQLNDVIYHSGISLLTIINDLLDLSRLENGKIVLEPTNFDIKQVMGHVALTLQAQVKQKQLDFTTQFAPDLPSFIRLDTGRLRQILFNLIGNAIKYTQAGQVVVSVAHNNNRLIVSITDTGRGIPADKLEAIFKPYEQVEDSAKERRSGAGLGLHIAHSLIDLMHGELRIESEVGKGTTVTFSLPALAVAAPVEDTNSAAKSANQPLTLLVADDNAINRKVMTGLAKNLGHKCLLAEDGAEAVTATSSNMKISI